MSDERAAHHDAVSPGHAALLACVLEVTAPKAGNVHAGASFDDADWGDFVTSAMVCRPLLDRACETGVGEAVLSCVRATRRAVGSNTNLGMLLLLAPLCAAPTADAVGMGHVLDHLTPDDTARVYEAIRLASPGGLGDAAEADVHAPPPESLIDAMRLAADRDAVARQYVTAFDTVFAVADNLASLLQAGTSVDATIVAAHLMQMAREPDTLIARKCGVAVAEESQRRAAAVLQAVAPTDLIAGDAFAAFDQWLRADGHRRNPGTSADLIAAGLYVALRQGKLRQAATWHAPLHGPAS